MGLKTSTHIGRYEILAEVGRGAMGVVYRAHDPKIDRIVAVKTILLLDLDPADEQEYRRRFYDEARTAGRLSHPGIVTVFDAESSPENASPYIVMEYVEGKSLKKLLSENKSGLPIPSAVRLGQEIAEALHFAHSQGIIHRDIKPENILVTPDGHAKIADFGIARMDQSHLTLPGRALGSPAYMSPEQLEGAETDARSDIFSLGVVLYTMLTGHRPFQGNSTATICFKLANRDPMPISAWNLDSPPELDSLVGRAMAKDPATRFQSGGEMARELQSFLDNHRTEPAHLDSIMRIIGQEPGTAPQASAPSAPSPVPMPETTEALTKSQPSRVARTVPPQPPARETPVAVKATAMPQSASPRKSGAKIPLAKAAAAASSSWPKMPWPKTLGIAAAVLVLVGGLALWSRQKHSPGNPVASSLPTKISAPLAPPIAAPQPVSAEAPAETEMEKLKREEVESAKLARQSEVAAKTVKPPSPPIAPPVPRPARQNINSSLAQAVMPPDPTDVTVHLIHMSDLSVTIEHGFEEGQASISVDNRVVFNQDLRGEKKRRALVFTRTQGSQSSTITLLPGTHDIVVRVQSPANGFDATQNLTQSFSPGSSRTLLVKCDKRKNRLALLLR